jgi:hypothetical protein
VREYAWQGAVAAGEGDVVRQRHFDWAMGLASRAGEGLTGTSQVQWLNRLDYDLDNLEAAFEWSLEEPARAGRAIDAVAALSAYWMAHGTHRIPGTRWAKATATAATNVDQATRTAAILNGIVLVMWSDVRAAASLLAVAQRLARGDTRAEAYAKVAAGYVAAVRGERMDLAELEAAVDTLADDELARVWASAALAWACAIHGDHVRAHELMSGACRLFGELGDEHMRGGFLSLASDFAAASGDVDAALAEASESLDLARTPACASCESQAQVSLALLDAAGDGAARVARARRGVALAAKITETINVLGGLDVLSATLALTGDLETAITLAAASDALRAASGYGEAMPARAALHRRGIEFARSRVDAATFEALWEAGASLSYAHAIELALAGEQGADSSTD